MSLPVGTPERQSLLRSTCSRLPGTVLTLKIPGPAAGAQFTMTVQLMGVNGYPGSEGATTDIADLLSISL
ncbi:MAG: hypothetical protein ABJA67_06890 [Chthonomonadales bacterium]